MTLETVETRLRKAGYRMTQQRKAIYQYLLSTDAHPTAETIHQAVRCQLPNISLGTVYKAVDSLVDVGLVNRIQRGASSARYDSGVEDHAHCRCLGCDGVWDAAREAIPPGDLTPEAFEVVHVNVEFVGYCADCRRRRLGLAPLDASIASSSL